MSIMSLKCLGRLCKADINKNKHKGEDQERWLLCFSFDQSASSWMRCKSCDLNVTRSAHASRVNGWYK